MRLKIYLDEDVPVQLANSLRRRGIDVMTTQESAMNASTDEAQLTFSVTQQRTMFTHNKRDFVMLHKNYMLADKKHWGVIVADHDVIGQLLKRLSKLCFTVSTEEMKNRLEFLGSWR